MTELEKLHYYLDRYADTKTNAAVREAWATLSAAGASMPNAGACEDGHILLTWDKGELHFELEVFPGAPAEFFFLNRTTSQDWEYDWQIGTLLPDEAIAYLNMVKP